MGRRDVLASNAEGFRMRKTLIGILSFCTIACIPEQNQQQERQAHNEREQAFRSQLLEIAAKYKSYNRVDGRMRLAPLYCAPPTMPSPDFRVSRSDDEETHGRKLYLLYAAKVDPQSRSYIKSSISPGENPVLTEDQIIVKESWLADEAKQDQTDIVGAQFPNAIGKDGKKYKATVQAALFIMFFAGPKTDGTDGGWVYGTVTPDGKTVTGVGRMESCMNCHQKAPYGRLFGLPKE
jgi:hypothetical protein